MPTFVITSYSIHYTKLYEILFLVDKRRIRDVEKLFQVGVTFL